MKTEKQLKIEEIKKRIRSVEEQDKEWKNKNLENKIENKNEEEILRR